jgi:hypothetical protein
MTALGLRPRGRLGLSPRRRVAAGGGATPFGRITEDEKERCAEDGEVRVTEDEA